MATIQLYRTDLSLFTAALGAIANTTPSTPTLATANTISTQNAAVYVTDTEGSYFVVSGQNLIYSATTGRLTGGFITSIAYQGFGTAGGSFATFGSFFSQVATLLTLATNPDPINTFFSGSNSIIADTASLTTTGGNDAIAVGGTMTSHIDGGAGLDTAIFRNLRGDATVSGGGGTETVTATGITTSLMSLERLQFVDGTVAESPSSVQGQTALAFLAVFGRLPDAINAGGYTALTQLNGVAYAAAQMLATTEGQSDTAGLDNGQFVTRIYQTVLGRAPSATELATARAPLDNGHGSRGLTVANLITSTEAVTVNATTFSAGVFAASPGAVDTLRAYEVLLGRLPEASSIAGNGPALDQYYASNFTAGIHTESLADLYHTIQTSTEFASRATPNPYGITAGSSFGTVYATTHSDALTTTNLALVTATGGVAHMAG